MKYFLRTTTFLTLLFLTITYTSHAQQWSTNWHEGTLVLTSGDTLQGDIRYDIENDAVQIRLADERIHSYSGMKVLTFEISEHPQRSKRRFYSLPYQQQFSNYYTTRLFEILHEGKLTLLCRPYQEQYFFTDEDESEKKKSDPLYEYFFLDEQGKVHLYRPRLGRLLSIMSAKHRDIRSYMKEHHLRYDQMRDLVRITAYYNAIDRATTSDQIVPE